MGESWLRALQQLRGVMKLETADLRDLWWWLGDPLKMGAAQWQVERYFYGGAPNHLIGNVDGRCRGRWGNTWCVEGIIRWKGRMIVL